jgi:molybdenum cofactor biosynthesis protein B
MSSVDEHRADAPQRLTFAVLTASDTRTHEDDGSGGRIVALATAAGHQMVGHAVIKDDEKSIRSAVREALSSGADVVVLNGGTGFSGRDVSIEALEPLMERRIEGFGELFRMLSFQQVGPAAMLSRAVAGVAGRSVVFALPGSPKAVELAMTELILPEAAHLLGQIRR